MSVRVISEPSLNVKSFSSLSISSLTKDLVAFLVNFGAVFIHSCVSTLRAAYGKAKSNSPIIHPGYGSGQLSFWKFCISW